MQLNECSVLILSSVTVLILLISLNRFLFGSLDFIDDFTTCK